jgi:hypothetical protein
MPRLSTPRGRLSGFAAIIALSLLAAPAAWAHSTSLRLHLTHAPYSVRWHSDFGIKGLLENGSPGMEVSLQRSVLDGPFRHVETKSAASDDRVAFAIHNASRTSDYRLVYSDASGTKIRSKTKRVRVHAGVTLHVTKRNVFTGGRMALKGRVYPATPGRSVVVQQRVHGTWRNIASPSVGDGSYRVRWRPKHKGHRRVRVRFSGDPYNIRSKDHSRVNVYVKDPATWYGPGFYGHRTACGKTLTRHILGVANRHLPCGTQVSFMYHGNVVTVPVIDRGPYGGADWDLTRATARRLSFSGSAKVGTTR